MTSLHALPQPRKVFRLGMIAAFVVLAGLLPATAVTRANPLSTSEEGLSPHPLHQDAGPCENPANPVVAENCLPGSDDWIVDNYLHDIDGFAYPPSVEKGETVTFYVDSGSARADLMVYRSGYYQGAGARLMLALTDVPVTRQPNCLQDRDTGLTSCVNWSETYQLEVPDDWVSGVYFVKLVRQDTGGESYMFFVVRDDSRPADILYQQSLFTFHAYNEYGSKSLYDWNSGYCLTSTNNPRAAKVSLYRPYAGLSELWGSDFSNNYFRTEFPMVRWLEAQGYDVAYSTDLDTHHSGQPDNPNALLNYPVFLIVGHDEYWTQQMRDAVTEARDAGVHIGVFSANTMYWRVRLEDDPWTGEPDSVIVTYKTTEAGIPDPSGHPTGTWRDPATVDDPESEFVGVQYIGDNDSHSFPMRVTAEHGTDRIYRHTDLQTMPPGTYANLGEVIVGWEWDNVVDNGHMPEGVEILAESPTYGMLLQDAGESDNADADFAQAHTARYVAPSGAIVFASGFIRWAWGLGAHGTQIVEKDPYLPQITYNILADMGVQPASPQDYLILDGNDERLVTSPPEAFLDLDPPVLPEISDISLDTSGSLRTRGRTVTFNWETNVETTGQVWLGVRQGYVNEPATPHTDYTLQHSITLTSASEMLLRPNHTYYYKLMGVDRAGNIVATEERSFTTPANLVVTATNSGRDTFQAARCWAQGHPRLYNALRALRSWERDFPWLVRGVGAVIVLGLVGLGLRVLKTLRNRRRSQDPQSSGGSS